jgi:hypothetical protein
MFALISLLWSNAMSRLGILGATALSLTLAVTPALAQHVRSGGGAAFRGAQASVGSPGFAGRSGAQFAAAPSRGGAQFTQGTSGNRAGFDRGFRRDHDGRFGRGAGFVAGLAVGSAFGYGAYDPYYYGDDYAYNNYDDGGYYDQGYPVESGVVVSSAGGDASYCAQRYRSYDPASGTYLGFDGLRHPCL